MIGMIWKRRSQKSSRAQGLVRTSRQVVRCRCDERGRELEASETIATILWLAVITMGGITPFHFFRPSKSVTMLKQGCGAQRRQMNATWCQDPAALQRQIWMS